MQKVFENGNGSDREILIKVEDGAIWFFFYQDYRHQQNWVNEEIERRRESGEEELTEEEKRNYEFYWIEASEWKSDRTVTRQGREDNWHEHMKRKNWFTPEMEKFLNDNTP